jgi:D-alanyl-lipoteichoic acid acyltransferase DltB (MBOAT superfamily)
MGHESGLVILVEWLLVLHLVCLGCVIFGLKREAREEVKVLKIIFKEIIKIIKF